MRPADILDENKRLISAVDYYFLQDDGSRFKVSLPFRPYFYILAKSGFVVEVQRFLERKYAGIMSVELVLKEDLDLPNHLIGLKQNYLKLSFNSVNYLQKIKRELMPRIRKNRDRELSKSHYMELLTFSHGGSSDSKTISERSSDQIDNIVDIRECDVPYHVRVSIDCQIFVGHWYSVLIRANKIPEISKHEDLLDRPDPIVLAFDIETTKLPLKFPDAQIDQIMMISYMIDGQGYLIINRQIVSSDVDDFEYSPKPEYEGSFTVFNEADEQHTIQRFLEHIQDVRPHIIVTYNGDMFDWPFLETRAALLNLDLMREIGFAKDSMGEYKARQMIHMDAFRWVKRDSYLPIGSQNLKACTKAKLRYDPVELDPEEMCRMAAEQPQVLANYSVSDAVATYYLYMKYVHPFIFALCTIIPMEPDEVLRKGSGTLCEALLMVKAFNANIIFPNKQETVYHKTTGDGHLLQSETYVGGHVEALESGIFRDDIPCRFRLDPGEFQQLIDNVDRTVEHAITEEEGVPLDEVTNFTEVCNEIRQKLTKLRDCPMQTDLPIIYHLDVGAMYPNIILTNRLQPPAIVNDAVCAACDYNRPDARCQRVMNWTWRGEVSPANRSEFQLITQQLEGERFPSSYPGGPSRAFHQLSKEEQSNIETKRLNEYCRKAYKRLHETRIEVKGTTVCQRENSFYVDTVRAFRDRRYEYKAMLKVCKKNLETALEKGDASEIKSAKSKEILFDSLQTAHKCILNSFYGYVMRKGSRWHSMEMAGIVCYIGAKIITTARQLIEHIGRPLELDTDGIWCILPASFPLNFVISTLSSKKPRINLSYPGAMLNITVKDLYTNDQYHELVDRVTLKYEVRSENSIFFEVDGPYRAMVLPAAKEEGKKLKKRYAVYNKDGSLAELKGFEMKRRGELGLIKIFQSQVFDAFLKGKTLTECYASVAKVADFWLDVLYSKATNLPDVELFDLISENRSMSRKLEDYGAQKSTSIATAKRLAEFLGDQMVKDAGLSCRYVIAKKPEGAPVTERAIPLAIFQAEPAIKKHYLKKWLKASQFMDFDIRNLLDWEYYIERLGSAIQKIVTIPAAFQEIANPVPRVHHPDWLQKRLLEKNDNFKQKRINEIFIKIDKSVDIENIVQHSPSISGQSIISRKRTLNANNSKARNELNDSVVSDSQQSWKDVLGPLPPMGDTKLQQLEWLSYHKRKWEWMRRKRSSIRRQNRFVQTHAQAQFGLSGASFKRPYVSFDNYFRGANRGLLDGIWQILQISETSVSGLFKIWVLLGNSVHLIRLQVLRKFYVNQTIPKKTDADALGRYKKVLNRSLPRSNRLLHCYEYNIPELEFEKRHNELYTEMSMPEVEGIYETQVPPLFRVFCRLGCLCQVSDKHRRRLSNKKELDLFELDDLEFRSLADSDYLIPGSVRHLFLYHYSQADKEIYGFFDPSSRTATVILLNPKDSSRTDNVPDLKKTYTNERLLKTEKFTVNNETINLPSANYQFDKYVESDSRKVYRVAQKFLQNYKDKKLGPTVLIFQSSLEGEQLTSNLPALASYPLVKLHIRENRRQFSDEPLKWQKTGVENMFRVFLNMNSYLESYANLCRYLHIPLGNVPREVTMFGSDLFFARHLLKHGHILWCSSTDRPDLGGKEVDDHRLIVDDEEQSTQVNINQSGCYPTVCLELEINHLPVNSLIWSHHIAEEEGGSGSVGFDCAPQRNIQELMTTDASSHNLLTSMDETVQIAPALRILKNMVHGWVKDIDLFDNMFADMQIMNFVRWLRSPHSLLYEPALKKALNALMKKLLMQLVAELKRLGAIIVHANLNRIVLASKKKNIDDAMAYWEFIWRSVRQKEMFSGLDLTVRQKWHYLCWLDSMNYGGVVPREDSESQEDLASTEAQESSENSDQTVSNRNFEIASNWNMAYYLPSLIRCREFFYIVVETYIKNVFLFVMDWNSRDLSVQPDANVSTAQITQMRVRKGVDDLTWPELAEFCQQFVNGQLMELMLGCVTKVQNQVSRSKLAREKGTAALFPCRFGSHLNFSNPALELIKDVCKVLSLDSSIEYQVLNLRGNSLRLIQVGEFSPLADWEDPCASHVLPQLVCSHCCMFRDLDLCRDIQATQLDDKMDRFGFWRCIHCGNEYNRPMIEQLLLETVHRLSITFALQDLKCSKCKLVKMEDMSLSCVCAGQFGLTVSSDAIKVKVRILQNIVNSFPDLALLSESLDFFYMMNRSWLRLLKPVSNKT